MVLGQKDLPLIERMHLNVRNFSPCTRWLDGLLRLIQQIAVARKRPFTGATGDVVLTCPTTTAARQG